MLQVLQNVKSGELELKEVPPPALLPAGALVRNGASLISAGTEKVIIDLGQKSLLGKARARPELVRQVLNKARSQGLVSTFHNVMSKIERPVPLGYSAAGIIEEVGSEVLGLKIGDRVAIAGAGYANHAEMNYVPRNLIALIPPDVSFEEAAYSTVASIAMQGVRIAQPELGEIVVVSGLGLIGLITIQLLRANGCRVLGIDFNKEKVAQALSMGLDEGVVLPDDDPHSAVDRFSKGRGADLTLITAATTSDQPIHLAGELTRRKGRVVVVGTVGLNIPRDIYYRKELDVRISMSYGPGRYDPTYEEGGLDYPYDYVRWTEQRNMESVLELMSSGRLDVRGLTSHRFRISEAARAYELIKKGDESYVGIILDYDLEKSQEKIIRTQASALHKSTERLGIGFVGAGNYSSLHLLPHLKRHPAAQLIGLVSATGLNAKQKADKFGFDYCATDIQPLLDDSAVDAVFIATRHSTHADFAIRALQAGKHVFVEKPMVVSEDQLEALTSAYEAANLKRPTGLMVGLNRRFAPMISRLKESVKPGIARQMIYRVNSGHIPRTSWLHEPAEGAGMLIGEMCHFVDLMQAICGERPLTVFSRSLSANNQTISDQDNLVIVISYDGGSVGTLCYNTVGNKTASKERLEIYGGGIVAALDDFRVLEITTEVKPQRMKSANQNKGQERQIDETLKGFRTQGQAPIPFSELVMAMKVIFAAQRSVISGEPEDLTASVAEQSRCVSVP